MWRRHKLDFRNLIQNLGKPPLVGVTVGVTSSPTKSYFNYTIQIKFWLRYRIIKSIQSLQ